MPVFPEAHAAFCVIKRVECELVDPYHMTGSVPMIPDKGPGDGAAGSAHVALDER